MHVTGHTGRPASIRDVATAAGVSYQTVSRVINDHPRVSPDTRERVLAAVEALGFRRNPTAFALASGRRRAVTVLTSNTTHYGYASVLRGVEEAARAASYSVGIGVLESAEETVVAAEVRRAADNGGGLIVIAYDPAGVRALDCLPPGLPFVAVVETPASPPRDGRPWVWTDDRRAAYEATRHLLSLGHETVHYVALPSGARRTGPRTSGWRQALRDAGAPQPRPLHGGWGPEAGHTAGLRLARDPAVTAVLCGNDDLALGVLRALHESGRAVPGEVSVAGFDDAPHAAFLTPELTTVRLDFAGLGRAAFARLHTALEESAPTPGEPVPPHSYPVHEPRLLVRESSGPPPAPAAVRHRLTVDLAASEGPVLHGANGALYGLSDDGVPGDAVLAPLRISGVSQKPEGGAQHPNGDALTVAESFFRNGGGEITVLLQDSYAQWPYEDLGIDDHLARVDGIVREIAARPDRDRFVYVPFNEPDQIWYRLDAADPAEYEAGRDRFLRDWRTVYRRIRALHPGARIAGPNEAAYHARLLTDFLAFARREDVLPQVMTWHELDSSSLRDFQAHYDEYRAIEQELGIPALTVSIDEYANRRDLSVPGQLVQWVAMFERNKVYAQQAYWDAAGDLSGNVVRMNIPNGGWWFFRWYAGLTGDTVRVTPPEPHTVDTLQGLASLDTGRRQAQVLLGGSTGDADVVVQNVPGAVFGRTLVATVAEAGWSGYEGPHPAPRVLARTRVRVAADGSATVPLRGLRRMSAYRIVLTPAGRGTPAPAHVPWSASYEAEDAAVTGGRVRTHGTVSDANGYAASGTRNVESLGSPGDRVDFTVTVPADGGYDLAILYGNGSGGPATQHLSVDGGAPVTVTYPSTQNAAHGGRREIRAELAAGTHVLTLAAGDGEVTLDRLDLTARSGPPSTAYEATLAEAVGTPSYDCSSSAGTGTGALVLGAGDAAVFDVYAPRDGYFTLVTRASAEVELTLHGTTVTAAPDRPLRLYLAVGNNRVTATGQAALRALEVSGDGDEAGVLVLGADTAVLAGGARTVDCAHAPGGLRITGLGGDGAGTARFPVEVSRPGRHLLVVHYAHDDRRDNGHAYNTDIVSRTADLSVGGGAPVRAAFKNTWSGDDFWTLAVPVDLVAGGNTVTFAGADGPAPDIARIELGRIVG
ncbi:substrate-binding domain-containing protein [Streptomyces sp. YKOK-I1]